MEIVGEVKHELVQLVRSKYNGETSLENIIEFMWGAGMLDKKTSLRYCIRAEYYDTLKEQNQGNQDRTSCFGIKVDIADKFDVELDFVNNAIYKYTHLSL